MRKETHQRPQSRRQSLKKTKRQPLSTVRRILFFIISVLFLIVAAGVLFFVHETHSQKPFVADTQRNSMKKLPPDIKKELQYASPSATFRVPILMYHYVEYVKDKGDKIRISLNIIPAVFEQQVITLQQAGYTFMTAKDLADALDGKRQMPDQPVLLTFDDGYRDFYTDVYPILQAYNVKATSYIIPGFLNQPNFMTDAQVQEIASKSADLIDIGAHTVHHVWLKGLPYITAQKEINDSKTMLEQLTGHSVVSFAYPYGALDKQAVALVADAGFTTAVSTIPGINASQINRFFLYRIRPGARTGASLLQLLQQNSFNPF